MKKIGSKFPRVIIRDKIYVPVQAVPNLRGLKELYTTFRYDEASCRRCEVRAERHSVQCGACEAFKGIIKLYSLKTVGGRDCIGLPIGDKKNFERKTGLLFSELRIVDRRTDAPFTVPIKFTGTLREGQVLLTNAWLKKKYGIMVAPPRSGKTISSLFCCIELGQRVLFMASQHEFLTQFLDHIHGNEKEGIPKCTNLPELEKKYGKKLYGFPKTDEDYENFQIFCATPQQFYSEKNGKDRFNKIKGKVGALWIDEIHKSSATEFAKVVSSFPVKHKGGCTGTVFRKDCFVGSTLVHTDFDQSISIRDIVDNPDSDASVLSKNSNGTIELKRVVQRHKVSVKKLVKVVANGTPFMCTLDHEWWSKTRNCYVAAKDLIVGEELEELNHRPQTSE